MTLLFDFPSDLGHSAGISIPDTPGNDASADDGPAIQAAIDAAEAKAAPNRAAVVWLKPGVRYYLPNGGLVMDNTLCSMYGNGAKLDWTGRTFVDPDSLPELITNGTFAGSSVAAPWSLGVDHNSSGLVVGGGVAANTANDGLFSQFGQQVATIAGRTYRFVVQQTITPVATQQYVNYAFRSGGVGLGSSTANVTRSSDIEAALGEWEFTLTAPDDDMWLTIQSNNDFNITSVVMREEPDNSCFRMSATAASPQFGHTPNGIQNLGMYGPGKGSFADGLVYDTDANLKSQRGYINNSEIQSFQRGIVWGARTYLVTVVGSVVRGNNVGLATIANSPDAGENFGWYHGVFGSNDVAVLNDGGFRLNFHGPSFDYGKQIYVGEGICEFNSCWFEHGGWDAADAAEPDFAETQYRFDVRGGSLFFTRGLMQYTQVPPSANFEHEHLFRLANRAHVVIDDMVMRNVGGSSGEYATGDGLISIKPARLSSPQNSPVVLHASDRHNLVGAEGGFEGSEIGMDVWVSGGTTATHNLGRHVARVGSQPTRTGDVSAGSTVVTSTDTTLMAIGDLIIAPGFVEGTTVTSVVSPTQMLVSSPWLSPTETGASFVVVLNSAGTVRAELSNSEARTGSKSLRMSKEIIGGGTGFTGFMAFPVESHRKFGARFFYKIPTGLGTEAFTLFLTARMVRASGMDNIDEPPTILDAQGFFTANIAVDLNNGIDWTEQRISSINADTISPTDGFTPHWATHVLVQMNMVNAPAGFELYVDDFHANPL